MNDSYKTLSVDYDALNPKEEIFKQKKFFEKLIKRYAPTSCLDCACGTGWHLLMLDEMGLDCAGSDVSNDMLEMAKKNLEGHRVPLKKENFQTLQSSWGEKKFDMIICMTTSFPHNETKKHALQTLKSMYALLNDGGIVVIDNGFADSFFEKQPKYTPARVTSDQAFYIVFEYPRPSHVIFNILNIKKHKAGFEHSFDSMSYLALKKKDFEEMFSKTKFTKIHYYGDHSFSKYLKTKSKRTVIVAEK